MKQKLLYYYGD